MTKPLLYDIKRTFTSKSVLILMGVMVAFGFAIIPAFTSVGGGSGSPFPNIQILTYYDSGGGYHFLAFAWNQYGQPLDGIAFQASMTLNSPFLECGPNGCSSSSSSGSPAPTYKTPSVSTNSSGEAIFTVTAPVNSSYYVSVSFTQPNGFNSSTGFNQPYLTYKPSNGTGTPFAISIPPGQVVGLYGNNGITIVTDSSDASKMNIQALWAGSYGAKPSGYALYYKFLNVSSSCPPSSGPYICTPVPPNFGSPLNESNMQLLATMNTYRQVFSPPKLEPNLAQGSEIALALFYPNGTMVGGAYYQSVDNVYPPPPPPINPAQGTAFVLSFFQTLFGIFVPLLAIVGSFNSYGKDRVSGVLESVLAQPVSRKGLSLSRFISSFAAMTIAVSIAVAVVDIIAWSFTKSFVSNTIIFSSAGAFFMELAVFIAVMMLLSHVIRSSGSLIGVGIGLFIVIDFFWGIIISILASLTNTLSFSTQYYRLIILAEFVNPAQFVSLVDTYLTHQASFVGIGGIFTSSLFLTPEAYGVTIPAIIATAILWIALPLAAFLYLSIRRD